MEQWVRPGRCEATGRQPAQDCSARGAVGLGVWMEKGNRLQEESLDCAGVNEESALVPVTSPVTIFALMLGLAFPAQALNRAQDESQILQVDVPHYVPKGLVAGARWT